MKKSVRFFARRLIARAGLALLLLLAGGFYVSRLGDAPLYLTRDEVFSAMTAQSLATTGRDLHGRFLPLYFQTHPQPGMWFQPTLLYAMALSVKVFSFSEPTIRLPMAVAGLIDVLLIYLVARLAFRREALAIAAVLLLAFAPAHLIHSRMAMDFQAPVPFVLAWLFCLCMYLRHNARGWLFAAGTVLGMGLFTHIAAYALMPVYVLLTSIVLYRRRDPLRRHLLFAGAFALPLVLIVPFLFRYPIVARDILWHYQLNDTHVGGPTTFVLLRTFLTPTRFAEAIVRYMGFWSPRLLFVSGPHATWTAGLFLLPVASLLVVGVIGSVSRPGPMNVLLIGGLLAAPIPVSLLDEPEAVRRFTEVQPFAILLAIAGLQYVWEHGREMARRMAFVALWAATAGMCMAYHGQLPDAQSLMRASTVPLGVAGLAVLFAYLTPSRLPLARTWVVVVAMLVSSQLAFMLVDHGLVDYSVVLGGATLLLVAIGLLPLLPETAVLARRPQIIIALLALVSSLFIYFYMDHREANIRRIGFIPAYGVLMMVRLSCAALPLVGLLGLRTLTLDAGGKDTRSRLWGNGALFMLVAIQVAYFYLNHFQAFWLRTVQSTAVLAAILGVAFVESRIGAARLRLGQITAAAVVTLSALQFAHFAGDYFGSTRISGDEGNLRLALERAIEKADDRVAPTVYLGKLGYPGFDNLYWQFYLTKHHRLDLLPRTIIDHGFTPDRVRGLPSGSIVVTTASDAPTTQAIDRMVADHELRNDDLVKSPDGYPIFRILETSH